MERVKTLQLHRASGRASVAGEQNADGCRTRKIRTGDLEIERGIDRAGLDLV